MKHLLDPQFDLVFNALELGIGLHQQLHRRHALLLFDDQERPGQRRAHSTNPTGLHCSAVTVGKGVFSCNIGRHAKSSDEFLSLIGTDLRGCPRIDLFHMGKCAGRVLLSLLVDDDAGLELANLIFQFPITVQARFPCNIIYGDVSLDGEKK